MNINYVEDIHEVLTDGHLYTRTNSGLWHRFTGDSWYAEPASEVIRLETQFQAQVMRVKTISLWQPWASLVVIGAKPWETRSWDTSYRGPLAIHAAKRWTPSQRYLVSQEPFKSALMEAGIYELPLGKVLGKVDLISCCPTVGDGVVYLKFSGNITIGEPELSFGDFSRGRYAWKLENPERLASPIPATGRQRFWTFEMYPRGTKE